MNTQALALQLAQEYAEALWNARKISSNWKRPEDEQQLADLLIKFHELIAKQTDSSTSSARPTHQLPSPSVFVQLRDETMHPIEGGWSSERLAVADAMAISTYKWEHNEDGVDMTYGQFELWRADYIVRFVKAVLEFSSYD